MFKPFKDGVLKKCMAICCFLVLSTTGYAQQKNGWRQLFNGRNLANWDTWLRGPNMLEYEATYDSAKYQPVFGLNNDPRGVFTVHDGLLHISGEIWGAVTTKEEFSNYHLRFETKWGEKKWREKSAKPRDAGLLFHCTGPFDYAFKCWMRSMEMQIQEGEIGDFFNVGGGDAESQVTPAVKTIYNETADQYNGATPPTRHPGRIWRSGNYESPAGEWTTSELVARHADAVFIVNGFVVNRLYNIYRNDLKEQVTSGKLQFQSEGAEHDYRKIEIRPISFAHSKPILSTPQKNVVVTATTQQIQIKNTGGNVELIAVELLGVNAEQFKIQLPKFPLVLKKGETMNVSVSLHNQSNQPSEALLRLETVLGPVSDFAIQLRTN